MVWLVSSVFKNGDELPLLDLSPSVKSFDCSSGRRSVLTKSKLMLWIRGALEGPRGQIGVGTCGVGGVCGDPGDGGLDRDDFLDAEEKSLARLFFFFSVFPGASPSPFATGSAAPNPPSTSVIVYSRS